jgi:hypothetical protein
LTPAILRSNELPVVPGICRICGCVETDPCLNWITRGPCGWLTPDETLCDSPACVHIDMIENLMVSGADMVNL